MGLYTLSYQTRQYNVATPIYEGPLDLLLQLIERAELDITRLALAQVTDQYLAHLRNLPSLPAEEVSAFLVIAAKLLQIKSEVLLPRPPTREAGEEDPGDALTRQLLLYRQFKRVAEWLEEREANRLQTYLRVDTTIKHETVLDISEVGLVDLVSAAQAILFPDEVRSELKSVISLPVVTIRDKIHMISHELREKKFLTFSLFLQNSRSRIEIVVTFLALLELIKRHVVQIYQESQFGEINITLSADWDDNEEFELEFGE